MNLQVESEDYLQDIAFDYYNNRMAVCSSDRRIRIFKNNCESKYTNNWQLDSVWEAHDTPVIKIIFSSPEFGSLLASCGYDKKVNIWQEKIEDGKSAWITKAKITDFSDNVEDISFCSKIFGLKLAVCTSNGKIKIFEPKDYFFYVNWNCTLSKDINLACSSICWNPSPLDPQSFVVGCYKTKLTSNEDLDSIESYLIQVYVYCDNQKDFVCKSYLNRLSDKFQNHSDSITHIEWAPQFGRSYHLIASCSLDKSIKIWKFELDYSIVYDQFNNISIDSNKVALILNVEGNNPVYRVSFNLSGTILCSNDSTGQIRLFKKRENIYKEVLQFNSNN